jgi:hypothetical protein
VLVILTGLVSSVILLLFVTEPTTLARMMVFVIVELMERPSVSALELLLDQTANGILWISSPRILKLSLLIADLDLLVRMVDLVRWLSLVPGFAVALLVGLEIVVMFLLVVLPTLVVPMDDAWWTLLDKCSASALLELLVTTVNLT